MATLVTVVLPAMAYVEVEPIVKLDLLFQVYFSPVVTSVKFVPPFAAAAVVLIEVATPVLSI